MSTSILELLPQPPSRPLSSAALVNAMIRLHHVYAGNFEGVPLFDESEDLSYDEAHLVLAPVLGGHMTAVALLEQQTVVKQDVGHGCHVVASLHMREKVVSLRISVYHPPHVGRSPACQAECRGFDWTHSNIDLKSRNPVTPSDLTLVNKGIQAVFPSSR